MTGPVVLDNTVLSNFALVDAVELVKRLWEGVAGLTPAVLAEYKAGASHGTSPAGAWADLPVLTLTENEAAFVATLSTRLGAGERASLAVAVHRRGLLASDDRDARNAARQHGVPTTGTLGILAACVRLGYLGRNEGNALLAKMIVAGYRSPVTNLDQLLDV